MATSWLVSMHQEPPKTEERGRSWPSIPNMTFTHDSLHELSYIIKRQHKREPDKGGHVGKDKTAFPPLGDSGKDIWALPLIANSERLCLRTQKLLTLRAVPFSSLQACHRPQKTPPTMTASIQYHIMFLLFFYIFFLSLPHLHSPGNKHTTYTTPLPHTSSRPSFPRYLHPSLPLPPPLPHSTSEAPGVTETVNL